VSGSAKGASLHGASVHGSDCVCARCVGAQPGNALAATHSAYVSPVKLDRRAEEIAALVRPTLLLYSPADEPVLRLFCVTCVRIERASAALSKIDETGSSEIAPYLVDAADKLGRLRSDLRGWINTARNLANDLGMTPRSRAALGLDLVRSGDALREYLERNYAGRRRVSVPRVGLLEACDDSDLLAVTLWPKQREIIALIDSGRYREVVLALGRRSGKNFIGALVAVHDAAFRDLSGYLRAGETRYVLAVAANREQAGITLQFVRELINASPLLRGTVRADTEDAIEIRQPHTGATVVIKTMPCSARTGRGLAVSTLVLDELAHFQTDSEGPAAAKRVYQAVAPSVAQFQGEGRILALSTPWGRSDTNLFWRLFERASTGAHPDMLAVQAPTWEMNPTLPEAFFDAERAKDPEMFRGEFGAEFLASGGAFLDFARIEAAVDEDRFELPPGAVAEPVAALDVAFVRDQGRDRDRRTRP
jgi:hypothetical protein